MQARAVGARRRDPAYAAGVTEQRRATPSRPIPTVKARLNR
jgi:hypothetical protein